MAFPSVVTRTGAFVAPENSSHPITLPPGNDGDLWLVMIGVNSNPTMSAPSGWRKVGQQHTSTNTASLAVFAGVVGTAPDPSTFNSLLFATESAHNTYLIQDWSGDVNDIEAQFTTGAGSGNPPNLTPTGGAKDYLWVAAMTTGSAVNWPSAGPASYSSFTRRRSGSVSVGGCVGSSERQLNAASEDPGTFTNTSDDYVAVTIAVPPVSNLEIILGTITETGTANSLSGAAAGSIGTVVETGTANALTGQLSGALGLVIEIGSVESLGLPFTLGTITETGTANALSGAAAGSLGLVAESGTANALTGQLSGALGPITEIGNLDILSGVAVGSIGTITETGTANSPTQLFAQLLGLITETSTVYTLSGQMAGSLGLVTETGTVNAPTAATAGQLGLVTESGALNPTVGRLEGTIGPIVTADVPNALLGQAVGSLGLITETGTPNLVHGAAAGTLGLVTEFGELYPINGRQPLIVLGLIEETGTVQALAGQAAGTLALITETGLLLPLTLELPFALEQKLLKVVINQRALRLRLP